MTDIKTLRIGSHILWNSKRRKVDAITDDSIAFSIADTELKEYDSATIESVEPILITPALLEELGFVWKDEGCWQHWWKCGFDLTRRGKSPYWDYEGDISVQYLHELESLYYMIYETELIPD